MDCKRDNGRVERIKQFLRVNSLELAWDTFHVDFTHEFELDDTTYTHTLDHFIWSQNLSNSISRAGVYHSPSNTSDHSVIYCDVKRTCTGDNKAHCSVKTNSTNTKAFEEDDWQCFAAEVDEKLRKIDVPSCIECRDVHCIDENHRLQMDVYVNDVLKIMDSCVEAISEGKRSNIGRAKVVPGWTDVVKPFKDEALFWNAVWTSAGKPINNSLHMIMKKSRNVYHYAIRKCKRATENIKKEKLLNSCFTGKNNIFDELRRMRQVKKNPPTCIDGNPDPAKGSRKSTANYTALLTILRKLERYKTV